MRFRFRTAAFAVLLSLFPLFSTPLPTPYSLLPAQSDEQALRGRVQEFYSLLQVGRMTEAEAYLTQESKENFRYQKRNPFLGFEIKSVKLDASGKSATVLLVLQTLMPTSPTTPVPISSSMNWRLVDGVWYAVVPKPDLNAWKSMFSSQTGAAATPVPRPEELKFKGHTYNYADIPRGQVKVARFPFKNVTDHAVTITEVVTGCDCLKAKIEKKQYAPGESGELAIEFDSTDYERVYAQTVVVKTDPGGLITYLNVRGNVIPPPAEASKPAQEPKGKQP